MNNLDQLTDFNRKWMRTPTAAVLRNEPPLVVDLDGTLLRTDVLVESILQLVKTEPLAALCMPAWALRGRARFKRRVSEHVPVDAELLPYREDLLEYLREQHAAGRSLVLATGADMRVAEAIASHLGLFDRVLASDGETNLIGERKRGRLRELYGDGGFDYAGDSSRDLPVWSSARRAILVDPFPRLQRAVARRTEIETIFTRTPPSASVQFGALRVRQWVKNVLIAVPLLAALRFDEPGLFVSVLLAILAFGLCASGSYILNDLLDLPSDRRHPRKRHRPFAAGVLPLRWGLTRFPALILGGLSVGFVLPSPFDSILVVYLCLTLLYSLFVKTVPMLDVIVLSSLYTLRIMAGAAAVDIWPSHWLLGFSTFLFLSLAMVKRYGELTTIGDRTATFRGYRVEDEALLVAFGTASGYLAVLVLALYIATDTAAVYYTRYQLIWLICPMLLYWISHIWLTAHRQSLDDDPLVFALTDPTSRLVLLATAAVFAAAI